MDDDMCRIPISATYRIIDGEPVMISADYRDIPADLIARFLIQKFGKTPWKTGEVDECHN
ncbi:hypothetical protein NIF40_11495 [[Clostridium] leptum]|nr:hypothetical protein [[Clostridium] leptum]